MKRLEVKILKQYGVYRAYPACMYSQAFANMLQRKTLTRADLDYILKLGYEVIPDATGDSLDLSKVS